MLDKEVLDMTSKTQKEKTQGPPLLKNEGPAHPAKDLVTRTT